VSQLEWMPDVPAAATGMEMCPKNGGGSLRPSRRNRSAAVWELGVANLPFCCVTNPEARAWANRSDVHLLGGRLVPATRCPLQLPEARDLPPGQPP
jgi:hypothetical protein